ncbi:MAG: DUF456 domain-containing protein [Phycisphaerae bacterium]
MTIIAASVLLVLNTAWLGLLVLGLPGTWLIAFTTVGVAWWRWDSALPWDQQFIAAPALIALVALAVVGEIWEFAAGIAGARKAGASGWGSLGALVGAIIGGIAGTFMIPIPVIGSLAGACGGAAAGAWLLEFASGRTHDEAVRSGVGAGIGRVKGTLAKLAVGAAMWVLALVAVVWN